MGGGVISSYNFPNNAVMPNLTDTASVYQPKPVFYQNPQHLFHANAAMSSSMESNKSRLIRHGQRRESWKQ
jgi:hypothetical protein